MEEEMTDKNTTLKGVSIHKEFNPVDYPGPWRFTRYVGGLAMFVAVGALLYAMN